MRRVASIRDLLNENEALLLRLQQREPTQGSRLPRFAPAIQNLARTMRAVSRRLSATDRADGAALGVGVSPLHDTETGTAERESTVRWSEFPLESGADRPSEFSNENKMVQMGQRVRDV